MPQLKLKCVISVPQASPNAIKFVKYWPIQQTNRYDYVGLVGNQPTNTVASILACKKNDTFHFKKNNNNYKELTMDAYKKFL